jgi:hypothetical protein
MEVRRLLVLVAAILGATACLAESSSSSSLTSTRYVHLNGEDGQGREVDIVWGPASGAVDTVYGAGVSDCLWFQNDYAVHRGVSGDVDVLPGRDAAVQQARRIFLAGAYTALVPVRAVEGEGARAILYHAPGGIDVVVRSAIGYPVSQASVGTTQFANLQFDRDYAVGWHEIDLLTFQQKTFRRRGGLENIDAFPPEPRSPWARGNVADGPVVAAVAQRPARLLVRTGIRGLFVSRDFAHQVGAKVVDPQGSIVLLPDVVIAGNRVLPSRPA